VSVRISQARGDEDEKVHTGSGSPIEMLVGKGYSWKVAKSRLPPSRQVIHIVKNPRFLLLFGLLTAVVLLWQSFGSAAGEVQRYVP
jgi:hypothetical protein